MCEQMTFEIMNNATSSPGSGDGPTPSGSPDGMAPSGPAHVPANPSPWREKAAARMTKDTCGPLFDGLSPSAGLQLSLENRLRAKMACYGSPEYALTWKRKVMLSGPPICALRASGLRTSGKDYTGWPTPNREEPEETYEQWIGRAERKRAQGINLHFKLNVAAQTAGWPSPNTPSGGRSTSPEKMDATGRTKDGKKHTASLEHAVKFSGWPTASARDWKDTPGMAQDAFDTSGKFRNRIDQLPRAAMHLSGPPQSGTPAETGKQDGYRLNPMFSLYLQGYPLSWGISGFLAAISLKRKR